MQPILVSHRDHHFFLQEIPGGYSRTRRSPGVRDGWMRTPDLSLTAGSTCKIVRLVLSPRLVNLRERTKNKNLVL